MGKPAKQPYDESLVDLYEEQFLTQADTVYRFAFALTLSLDGASLCVKRTFKTVADNLPKLAKTADVNVNIVLIEGCWQAYHDLKGQKFVAGSAAVTKALAPLPVEARAALVAVDVAGLAPGEAARALRMSDKDLRVHLAHARRTLLSGQTQL